MYFSTLASGAALFHLSIAGYVLQDDYMKDFYSNFDFFTASDPTNGFVKFVDQATAQSTGLINSTSGVVSWGVDTANQAPQGRPSIRLTSKKSYNTGLVVLDVAHMPTGCGTWPAFWMVGPSWPNNGEIDILEGVNEQDANAMTLHTGPNCALDTGAGGFAGEIATSNCDVNAPNQDKNAGCSIKSNSKQSYGAGLNDIDGGVYATQWTNEAISVYFFPRGNVPEDVLGDNPDPSTWGQPAAKFSGACDIASTFHDQQIVFDTTFCGDWAGNVWSSGSCASKADTCNSFVQNHPEAFTEAYWTINALKVYTDNGKATPPSESSAPIPSSTDLPISSLVPSETPIETPTGTPIDAPTGLPISTPISTDSPDAPFPTGNDTSLPIFPTGTGSLASPAPLPTGNDTFPTIAPPASLPTGGETLPTSALSSSRGRHTRRPHFSRTQAQDSLAAAPTGGDSNGNMGNFKWPGNGQGQPGDETPAQSTGAPVVSSGVPVPTPTGVSDEAVTSDAPVPDNVVIVTTRVVHTVYETAVVTVPAGGYKRHERHVREHRRRMTQHNARR